MTMRNVIYGTHCDYDAFGKSFPGISIFPRSLIATKRSVYLLSFPRTEEIYAIGNFFPNVLSGARTLLHNNYTAV